MDTMMSTGVFSLFLLAVFVDCGYSVANNEGIKDLLSSNHISDYNEVEKKFLENNILRGIDFGHLCDDPHAAVCSSGLQNHTRPVYVKQAYPNIRDRLINILSQPRDHHQVLALSIEKALFSQCMKLGLKSDKENVRDTMTFISVLFRKISKLTNKWQDVDDMLNTRGFDFTFFDIGVERDPEDPSRNIIVLQPPSQSHIESLYDFIQNVFDPEKSHISKSLVYKFFDSLRLQNAVKKFYRKWTKVFSKSSTQQKQEKMTLAEWNIQYYNSTEKANNNNNNSQINWTKLIKKNFERINIEMWKNESLIVRNKNYFHSLANLLSNTSNKVIVAAMKAKLVFENIRYIDYKYAETIRHRKKSLFCLSSTKLHGASYQLLRELAKEDPHNERNFEILNTMLRNIANVLLSTIDDSKDLSSVEKTYLRGQVKWFTSDGVKYRSYGHHVDKYYDEYSLDSSYFVSIVDYRKMLKEKELLSLVHWTEVPSGAEPFSVVDLTKPRNRFIVSVLANSLLLSKQSIPSDLKKEVHYGIYGTKIASFLYGLLNENRFKNEVNLTGRVDWYDHPNYPIKSLQCFVNEDVKSYGRRLAAETVSQIFGTRIAYKAMLKDYKDSQMNAPYLVALSGSEKLLADQLFFVAYGKYNCDIGRTALKTILLNLDEYKSAFDCGSLHGNFLPQCPLNGFQIQTKDYFVNQPF